MRAINNLAETSQRVKQLILKAGHKALSACLYVSARLTWQAAEKRTNKRNLVVLILHGNM